MDPLSRMNGSLYPPFFKRKPSHFRILRELSHEVRARIRHSEGDGRGRERRKGTEERNKKDDYDEDSVGKRCFGWNNCEKRCPLAEAVIPENRAIHLCRATALHPAPSLTDPWRDKPAHNAPFIQAFPYSRNRCKHSISVTQEDFLLRARTIYLVIKLLEHARHASPTNLAHCRFKSICEEQCHLLL